MHKVSRRALLAMLPAASMAQALSAAEKARPARAPKPRPGSRSARGPSVVVVGAGAFGGWTALHLLRKGAKVTLVDAWGPGNSRASSGGETRVIRGTYGPRGIYTHLTARAPPLWKEHERHWRLKL